MSASKIEKEAAVETAAGLSIAEHEKNYQNLTYNAARIINVATIIAII